jgi:mannose-6-phosphate isomerase-like protein (cupin superfamily)
MMSKLFRKIVPATLLALSLFLLPKGAFPQAMNSDHWSPAELLERAKHLQQLAAQKGSASEKLQEYPHHYTMLAFRNRSGGGEVHQNFADLFYILDGHATLTTGGEVLDPKSRAPGETLGTSVKGGSQQQLKAGDVVHIPAGMPHQMLLADGDTVTYFVVKVEETR